MYCMYCICDLEAQDKNPEALYCLYCSGDLEAQDKNPEALAILTKTMDLCHKTVGKKHISTGLCLHATAALHMRQGDYVAAEALFVKAQAVGCEVRGGHGSGGRVCGAG